MNKGYVYLILAALSYASMGALVKILGTDLPAFTQLFLRLIFSAFLTLLLVTFTKSGFRLKKKTDYLLILPMGIVGYGLELSFYTLSFYHTTIGNALFIFSAYPLITAIFAFLFLKEKLTKNLLIGLALLFVSLILIFNPNNLMLGLLGNFYALLNALCFAVYIIFSRILSKNGNKSETLTLWTAILAILTSGIGSLLFEHPNLHLPLYIIFVLLIFGFLNFLAYNFVNKGFASVKAGVGTMLLSLEAVIGAIIGIIFFREIPGVTFLLGAILILAAVGISSLKKG